jgi:hypothetical protein
MNFPDPRDDDWLRAKGMHHVLWLARAADQRYGQVGAETAGDCAVVVRGYLNPHSPSNPLISLS